MLTKKDVLHKMANSQTWREYGYTVKETLEVLSSDTESDSVTQNDQSELIAEYEKTIENLRTSIRSLRAENKKLRGGK